MGVSRGDVHGSRNHAAAWAKAGPEERRVLIDWWRLGDEADGLAIRRDLAALPGYRSRPGPL